MDSIKPLEKRAGWDEDRIREYNGERLDSLKKVDWDLVIIDEAHRVAGSSFNVARYKMARTLADVSPYLLLLTATPHQGKTEPFLRLVRLLDKEAFPGINAVVKEQVAPYVIRTEKREAIDGEGNRLFKNRVVRTIDIPWEKRHSLQRQLYNEVTEYVRHGYNQAKKEKKNYIGFLMVLMQRLVTSSTRAIRDYLERRLEILKNQQENLLRFPEEEFYDGDMEESLKELMKIKSINLNEEKKDIKRLLALSKRAENQYMDCKAEVLLEYILKLDMEMDDLKLLIFTEFISTQNYLKELLEGKGYSVTLLNGSLTLEERVGVLEEFRQEAQILISTDAGGEGLNLQFCHIVINYDLPWNPMKIVQRIGRVDRIGQEKDVVAYNFILKDTVEYRVREVLEEKLIVIQEQYGIDKMGDVLDSSQSEMDFTEVYMKTIASPEDMEYFLDKIEKDVRDKTKRIMDTKELIRDEKVLDKSMVEDTVNLPIDTWVKDMYINYQLSKDNPVDLPHRMVINLNNQEVKDILKTNKYWLESEKIPIMEVSGLNNERGFWSLWEVSIGKEDRIGIFPMFINDKGIFRLPSSNIIWDNLIDESNTILYKGSYILTKEQYHTIYEKALELGYNIFEKMKADYDKKLEKYIEKYNRAFQLKEEAIRNIGLESIKKFGLNKLDMEKRQWEKALEKERVVLPSLNPISIIYLE